MTSTPSRVSSSRKPVISLMSRPSIFAEYTKPDFLSPSILKVTVSPLGDCFVQLSIISKTLRCLRLSLLLLATARYNLGIALAQQPDKRVNNAIWEWGKFYVVGEELVAAKGFLRGTGNFPSNDYSLLPIDGSMDYGNLFDSLKDALWGPSSPRGSQR